MECLVVVDVQACFSAARRKELITKIIAEVDRAVLLKIPIIAMEYFGAGPINAEVLAKCTRYERFFTCTKPRVCDGSAYLYAKILEIQRWLREEYDPIRFCGVQTTACVHDTVIGLSGFMPLKKMEIIFSATADPDYGRPEQRKYLERSFQQKENYAIR